MDAKTECKSCHMRQWRIPNENAACVVRHRQMRSMWRKGQLFQNAFLSSSWSLRVNECAVCPGQSAQGCGYSPLRAGMTSVGSKLGNPIPHCACWQRVERLPPLACCCKNVFRETGVRVDTVAVSLFLASTRNLLAGGGKRLIGWQGPRKRDLLPRRKKGPIGYSCCVAPGVLQPLCCRVHPASPWHSWKHHELTWPQWNCLWWWPPASGPGWPAEFLYSYKVLASI